LARLVERAGSASSSFCASRGHRFLAGAALMARYIVFDNAHARIGRERLLPSGEKLSVGGAVRAMDRDFAEESADAELSKVAAEGFVLHPQAMPPIRACHCRASRS
jgi:hypothetical protein